METNIKEQTFRALELLDKAMACGDIGAQKQAMSIVVDSFKGSKCKQNC